MKRLFIIIILLSTIILPANSQQLTGYYKTSTYSLFGRGMLFLRGVDGYVGGMELTLDADSTFSLKTCSVIHFGNWSVDSDSLYLEVLDRTSRSDSINNLKDKPAFLIPPYRPIFYEIISDGFYREIPLIDHLDNYKVKVAADRLIRVE